MWGVGEEREGPGWQLELELGASLQGWRHRLGFEDRGCVLDSKDLRYVLRK